MTEQTLPSFEHDNQFSRNSLSVPSQNNLTDVKSKDSKRLSALWIDYSEKNSSLNNNEQMLPNFDDVTPRSSILVSPNFSENQNLNVTLILCAV